MCDIIAIDRYESKLDEHGVIRYYAVKGKKRYPMPAKFKSMYTNDYLAISKKTIDEYGKQLYDMPEGDIYVPRRTGLKPQQRN